MREPSGYMEEKHLDKGNSKYKTLSCHHAWYSSKAAMAGWIRGGGDVRDKSKGQQGPDCRLVGFYLE